MARKKKKPEYEGIHLTDPASRGKSKGILPDGKVVLVSDAIPGDVVNIRIQKSKKNYAEGVITQLVEPSPIRIEPKCQHFEQCGGCKWQHLPYEKQLEYKQREVIDNLGKLGHVKADRELPILGSEGIYHYRNKLEFSFSNRRWMTREEIETSGDIQNRNALGFHAPGRWDKVIEVTNCLLQPEPSNAMRNAVREIGDEMNLPYFDPYEKTGFFRQMMVRNTSLNQWLVAFQFAGDQTDQIEPFLTAFADRFPEITSLQYCINTKANDSWYDLDLSVFRGSDHIVERMPLDEKGEKFLHFKIGVKSFYQTNPAQAVELYRAARQMADLKGDEIVYDLYSGTGTIAQFIAHQAGKVVGVESVEEAVLAARANALENDVHNAEFAVGDMAHIFKSKFIDQHGKPDVVITDPPRAGMHPKVVAQLIEAAPEKIVYVSCNPATQARDLELLSERYNVDAIQPVDMFPHTHHVENIALLTLRKS